MASGVVATRPRSGSNPEALKQHEGDIPEICAILAKQVWIPAPNIEAEVRWFYHDLAVHEFYFQFTPKNHIARHIAALYAAKCLAEIQNVPFNITLDVTELPDYAMFFRVSQPGEINSQCREIEGMLEEKYLNHHWCMASYRTGGVVSQKFPVHLRLYILHKAEYAKKDADEKTTDLAQIADSRFLKRATDNTKQIYSQVIKEVLESMGPVIRVFEFTDSPEKRVVVGYRLTDNSRVFANCSALFPSYGLTTSRKYLEILSNNIGLCSFYLSPIKAAPSAETLRDIVHEMSSVFVLPVTPLYPLVLEKKLSHQEHAFAHVISKFAYHFMNRHDSDTAEIEGTLDKLQIPGSKQVLSRIKRRLRQQAFSEKNLTDVVLGRVPLIKELYHLFEERHDPDEAHHPTDAQWAASMDEMEKKVKASCAGELDLEVMMSAVNFTRNVLKTNFYRYDKAALSFRLDPVFLKAANLGYNIIPFGVFFVVGLEFRGFHIRFADIARGGIRCVRSQNAQDYFLNAASLFDENYNLAYTQQNKNKDIPEGGSKGTVLLAPEYLDPKNIQIAFHKYVDAMLDILLPKGRYVDYTKRTVPEILFFGPDEYTAPLMGWAMEWAHHRGYQYWRGFTTGKEQDVGGIPHDAYGMTTRGVHQYVLGVYRKMGWKEEELTKMQTGGPDGDLGSNEILISRDKTIGLVDGSGVLHDPMGIDRAELARLAKARKMVEHFDAKKLSPKGFLVKITEKNITLPDGTLVESGLVFRNTFHLSQYAAADILVPCGGRPEAINATNFDQCLDSKGKPRWKAIVEGANLFITQQARLQFEAMGIPLFKDASANKGGVTSSSKEVLSAMALSYEEYEKLMCCHNGKTTKFYDAYVEDIIKCVETNARLEFEALWAEHARSGTPYCVLTNTLSLKIVGMHEAVVNSKLYDNKKLRDAVMKEAIPKTLLDLLGLEKIYERVPVTYMQAIFGAYIASRYVYCYGMNATEIQLLEFIRALEDGTFVEPVGH